MILADPSPEVSVVIPAHNEAENLPILISEIVTALHPTNYGYEIIVIDDHSTDSTPKVLRSLAAVYSCLVYRRSKWQGGQSAALSAGFDIVRGEIVVTLDADLQNDPADIPRLIEELGEADAVFGWRKDRQDPFSKRIISKVSNLVRNLVTREKIRDTGCGLKAFRRECLEKIYRFDGMHRFFAALLKIHGYRVAQVPVRHRPRCHGETHYNIFNRSIRPIMDLLAVRWLQKRSLHYCLHEEHVEEHAVV